MGLFEGYWAHKDAEERLSVGYKNTFDVLMKPENQNRFTEKERSSFGYISENSQTTVNRSFMYEAMVRRTAGVVDQMNFKFHAKPQQVLNTPDDIIGFGSAHEIKHTSLLYNHLMKNDVNILSLIHGADNVYQGLQKTMKEAPITAIICKPLAYVAKVAHSAFVRQEERICDEFALRAFPDIDVQQFKENLESDFGLRDNSNLEIEDTLERNDKKLDIFQLAKQNLKTITERLTAVHPSNESRYVSLTKMQQGRK